MPVVQMPDGAMVELPDNPTPEQLQQLRALSPSPGMATAREIGRVADKGLRGGLTALPGMIGDITLSSLKNLHKGFDALPKLAPGIGLPGLTALQTLAELGKTGPVQDTGFGDVTKNIQTLGGSLPPVSKPQTESGKALGNILEAITATVAGGGTGTVGQKAAVGAGAGSGGELAARLLDDNPLSRFLGSVVGGGAVSAGQALVPNSDKLIRQATEHVTDKDWTKAREVEKTLNASGIPHLKSQLLGPRSTLDDVVATASSNPSVRPKLATQTEGAPAAATSAIDDWTVRNLQPSSPLSRSEVLSDVQEAAAGALGKIKTKSNTAFERAMPPKHIEYDQGRVRTLYNSLRQLADDPRFGKTADTGKALEKFAERLVAKRTWDLSNVHPVVLAKAQNEAKAAGRTFDPSLVPGAKESIRFVTNAHKINNLNKEAKLMSAKEDFKGLPVSDIRRIMNQATPEFNVARDAKRSIIEREFNPASRGLTGQLAQMGGGVKQEKLTAKDTAISTIFNPTQPQGQAIRDLAKTMGGDQVGELLREHIGKTVQSVLKSDDKSPRRFVQAMYESPAQKENLEAALDVAAAHYKQNPAAVKVGFRRLMEALDSFQDLRLASGVSPGATAAEASQNVFSKIIRPITTFGRTTDQLATTKTYKQIADLVSSADGLQKLQAIAKAKKPEAMRQLVIGVLTSTSQAAEKGD